MTPLITKAVTFFPQLAADYKWFDKSDLDNGVMHTHSENMEAIKNPLPFSKCAIAGIDLEGQTYAVLISQEGSLWRIHGANTLATHDNKRVQVDPVFCINPMEPDTSNGITFLFDDPRFNDHAKAKEVAVISVLVIATFLRNLHAQRIATVYTPIPSKNHAKRMRQFKPPLLSWHTVMIEPQKEKAPSLGGTHASPRLHDVRGHWVTRGDKRFWRKPHQRGDATKGIVFHDYKMTEERRT